VRLFLAAVITFAVMLSSAHAQESTLKPYQKGNWGAIIGSADGAPLAVHFWGVTCPPCVKEMPLWGKFLSSDKTAKAVFIQVDDVDPKLIQKMLDQAKLGNANNYYVASSFDERLRYEIDPKWRGETPVTIFIDKNGNKKMTVGSVNFQEVKKWFKQNSR
jgi:thiol-disulfide isomerase/thioredoxin